MDIQTSIPGLDLWIGNTTAQTVLDSEIPLPEGRIAVSVLSVFAELHVEETACVEDGVHASGRLTLRLLCGANRSGLRRRPPLRTRCGFRARRRGCRQR